MCREITADSRQQQGEVGWWEDAFAGAELGAGPVQHQNQD